MVAVMRNPIQPSLDRPFPLPDRILRDGWWAGVTTASDERPDLVRLVIGENGEGPNDRRNPEQPQR